MSKFFQELKLPFPLKHESVEEILNYKRQSKYRPYLFLTRNLDQFLNDEIVNLFSDLKIYPDILIAFGHVDDINYQSSKPLIHSDIIRDEVNSTWIDVPFAINWELEDLEPVISWWDTKDLSKIYPNEIIDNDTFKYGNGIHYGSRMNRDNSKMICLEQYTLKKHRSVMIRTEIPHSVSYNSGFKSRTSISLRFPVSKISNWNQAIETFKQYWW